MRRANLMTLAALFVCLLVAGCSSATDDTTTSSSTTTPAATTTAATTTSTETVVAADASCVACHTDQATLQALAVEPVAVETLSEGEG